MIRRDFTGDELDALAGAHYRALHQDDCSEPWESLPSWRRWRYRRGVRALLGELERIEADHLDRKRATQRNTVRLGREEVRQTG